MSTPICFLYMIELVFAVPACLHKYPLIYMVYLYANCPRETSILSTNLAFSFYVRERILNHILYPYTL